MAHALETSVLSVARPYLIEQDWDAYTPAQHAVWTELVSRQMSTLREHACQEYLEGFEIIGLREDSIPNLAEVSRRLEPRTGWNSTPVSGFLPADAFFEMLAARRFPTTTWLRGRDSLEYTPEPDIFHDVFGHVPMHAHPVFADFLQQYGKVCAGLRDKDALERMGRLFWFTVEFGVIRQAGRLKIYGSGLISSHGEAGYVLRSAKSGVLRSAKSGAAQADSGGGPEIRDFNLDQVLEQEFLVSEMQKVLYAIDSFDQIYEAAQEAERRLA
jgi:phenylalanine-4-hydroxylase